MGGGEREREKPAQLAVRIGPDIGLRSPPCVPAHAGRSARVGIGKEGKEGRE